MLLVQLNHLFMFCRNHVMFALPVGPDERAIRLYLSSELMTNIQSKPLPIEQSWLFRLGRLKVVVIMNILERQSCSAVQFTHCVPRISMDVPKDPEFYISDACREVF